jgi:hypothetical protein
LRSPVSSSVQIEQPTLEDQDLEAVLPLSLVKTHCKIDDLPGITDDQLSLYRQAALEAAELYTGKKWIRRERIEQAIESPKFRTIAQAAIASVSVELDYVPLNGVVNIYGTGNQPLYWLDGMQLPFMRQDQFTTIKLPPGVQEFQLQNDYMFYSSGVTANCYGGQGDTQYQQQGLKAVYVAGPPSPEKIPGGLKLGALKYIAWSIENPGDQFVPMVVRQVGVTTVSNDPAFSSGAIDEWRRLRRRIAR